MNYLENLKKLGLKLPEAKEYLNNANAGKCHKYKEYEINPMPTNNFEEKTLVTNSSFAANHRIKQIPIIGDNVYNEGCNILSSKNKIECDIKSKPNNGSNLFINLF